MSDYYLFFSNGILQSGNTAKYVSDVSDANSFVSVSSIGLSNGTVTFNYTIPTQAQINSGNSYLGSNGSWNEIPHQPIVSTAPNTSVQVVDSWNANAYQAVIYDTSIYCGANVKTSIVSLIHNGSAANVGENNIVSMGGAVGTFAASYANGVVQLSFTPIVANTKVTVTKTQFPI